MNVELCFWADLKNQMFIEARNMRTIVSVLDLDSVNESKPFTIKYPENDVKERLWNHSPTLMPTSFILLHLLSECQILWCLSILSMCIIIMPFIYDVISFTEC